MHSTSYPTMVAKHTTSATSGPTLKSLIWNSGARKLTWLTSTIWIPKEASITNVGETLQSIRSESLYSRGKIRSISLGILDIDIIRSNIARKESYIRREDVHVTKWKTLIMEGKSGFDLSLFSNFSLSRIPHPSFFVFGTLTDRLDNSLILIFSLYRGRVDANGIVTSYSCTARYDRLFFMQPEKIQQAAQERQ